MFYVDERLAQQRSQERLREAEQERLVRAILRAQRQAVEGDPPTFRPRRLGRWLARRSVIQAPQP